VGLNLCRSAHNDFYGSGTELFCYRLKKYVQATSASKSETTMYTGLKNAGWEYFRAYMQDVTYQRPETVFNRDFQTSAEESWKYDSQRSNLMCLDSPRWNTVSSVRDSVYLLNWNKNQGVNGEVKSSKSMLINWPGIQTSFTVVRTVSSVLSNPSFTIWKEDLEN